VWIYGQAARVLTHPLRLLCDREGVFCGIRVLRCLSSAILFVVLCSRQQGKTLARHQGTATAIPRPVAVFLCASVSVWPPGGCLANLRDMAQSPPRQTSARYGHWSIRESPHGCSRFILHRQRADALTRRVHRVRDGSVPGWSSSPHTRASLPLLRCPRRSPSGPCPMCYDARGMTDSAATPKRSLAVSGGHA
jgi:hypothetical protein